MVGHYGVAGGSVSDPLHYIRIRSSILIILGPDPDISVKFCSTFQVILFFKTIVLVFLTIFCFSSRKKEKEKI